MSSAEEIAAEIPVDRVSTPGSWKLFGHTLPSREVVFFVQVLVVLVVLVTCVVNLSLLQGDQALWKYLLCSIVGYILPSPSLEKQHASH